MRREMYFGPDQYVTSADDFDDTECEIAQQTSELLNKHQLDDAGRRNSHGGEDEDEQHFMASKPWLGAIYPPSNYIRKDAKDPFEVFTEEQNNWSAPAVTLSLNYVFGYRARDCRNNVKFVDDQRIVFHAAAIGIVLNVETRKEEFFIGHDDDIVCLDYHREKRLVATGSIAAAFNAQLFLWSVDDPTTPVLEIVGFHQFAVTAVCFNPQGTLIASVGMDEHHSVALFSVADGTLVACCPADKNRIVDVYFNLCENVNSETFFVTVGVKHMYFWNPAEINTDKDKTNHYFASLKPPEQRLAWMAGSGCKEVSDISFLSVGFAREHVVVGASNGRLYIFHANRNCVERVFDLADGRVHAICNMRKNAQETIMSCGTYLGGLHFLNFSYSVNDGEGCESLQIERANKETLDGLGEFDMDELDLVTKAETHSSNSVRALCYDEKRDALLVGTILSHIYVVHPKKSSKTKIKATTVVGGHWGDLRDPKGYGELWGLDSSPSKQQIVTCADDRTVRIWDLVTNKEVARRFVKYRAFKVSWSVCGKLIAIGFQNGGHMILSGDLQRVLQPFRRDRRRCVKDIQFAPNSRFLAIGAENEVDVYSIGQSATKDAAGHSSYTFEKIGVLTGHCSRITAFDWNIESTLIQSCSACYELLHHDIPSCERLTGVKALADQLWYSQTCTMGWSVQGIWPRYADGTDINSVAKSRSDKWLVTTDDWGKVCLFNYPCVGSGLNRKTGQLTVRPEHHTYKGHASHVTSSIWTYDDSYVISAGGADLTLISWKVNYDNTKRPTHFVNFETIAKKEKQKELQTKAAEGANPLASDHVDKRTGSNIPISNLLLECYMCDFVFPDAVMAECPICFAPRRAVATNLRRAWVGKAEARFRMPTSAFAEHVKRQLKMRQDIESKPRPAVVFAPMGKTVTKVVEDEASCTSSDDDEEGSKRARKLLTFKSGTTRSGTHVNSWKPHVAKKKKSEKRNCGPEFCDY